MSMTKTQVYAALAERTGMDKKQVRELLDELAGLAYENASDGFTLPGFGKLVLVNRAARMGRNPATGEQIEIPAKKAVKFRIAKACKEAVLEKA